MRTLIIDADSLVYQAARAVEHEIQWSETLWTLHAELSPAIARLDDEVKTLQDTLEADEVVMVLSDYNDPWRKRIMPTYKSNRKSVRKPVVYSPLRDYIHEKYDTYQRSGLEGDDVIGVLLTNPALLKGEKIAVSLDKDMKTLPGLHLNLKRAQEKGEWTPFAISQWEADYYHLFQAVTGDTTDGYPGCPGVGAVSGAKLLDPFKGDETFDVAGAWQAILGAYTKKGLTVEDALVNARVARICRHEDFNYETKQVNLWNPPE
jgi:DNA polymerase I